MIFVSAFIIKFICLYIIIFIIITIDLIVWFNVTTYLGSYRSIWILCTAYPAISTTCVGDIKLVEQHYFSFFGTLSHFCRTILAPLISYHTVTIVFVWHVGSSAAFSGWFLIDCRIIIIGIINILMRLYSFQEILGALLYKLGAQLFVFLKCWCLFD